MFFSFPMWSSWMGFLEAFVYAGVAVQVFGLVLFLIWLQDRPGPLKKGILGPLPRNGTLPASLPDRYPGVTIIKPCHSLSDNEEVLFHDYFKQDYPGPVQLVFVVSFEDAPIVPLIRQLLAQYPQVDAQLLVSKTRRAYFPKTDALYDAHFAAKHEVVIWSDSDSIVQANYLTEMVGALQEPGAAMVTTPAMDDGSNNVWSALKTLANNADCATLVMYYTIFNRRKCTGFGLSIGFWKSDVDSIPGFWPQLFRYIGDDIGAPHQFYLHGKKVAYKHIRVPSHFANKSLRTVVMQKVRWLAPQVAAVGNRWVFFFTGFFAYPVIGATTYLLLSGFDANGIQVFGAAVGTRIFAAATTELLYLRRFRMTPRYFWTVPLWDLMQVGFFFVSLFSKHLSFGKKKYLIVDRWFLQDEAAVHAKETAPMGTASGKSA